MALELSITAKGQVTLRRALLGHLGVKPGDKVGVALLPDGRRPVCRRIFLTSARGAMK